MPRKSPAGAAFENYSDELHRYLNRRCGTSCDGDDLLQEVFARFVLLSEREVIENPRAYLYAIASNVLREFQKRRSRRHVTFDSDVADASAAHPTPLPGNDIFNQVSAHEEIAKALQGLQPVRRNCVLLHLQEGLTFDQIGERLGISPDTAKKYTTLALAHIRLTKLARK